MPIQLPPPPVVTEEVMRKIQYAEPPARFPRGYFDALITPTRMLLDQGLTLSQATDWLIKHAVLQSSHRRRYAAAMTARISRLRAAPITEGETYRWRETVGYSSLHVVGSGLIALCSARGQRWMEPSSLVTKCFRCQGIVKSRNLTITGEN
jgi:hypothetical protein